MTVQVPEIRPIALDEARAARGLEEMVKPEPGRGRRWVKAFGWRHLVAVLAVAWALFPVLWVVSAAFNPRPDLGSQRLIPTNPTVENFTRLLGGEIPGTEGGMFWRWYANSMLIGVIACLAITFLGALAAYAFSRMRFYGRRGGLLFLLLVQVFPATLAMVAIFLTLVNIGNVFPAIGIGTKTGLTLVYIGTGLGVNVWLMKGFFDTVPISLDESAKVDGASHTQIYFRIILPLVVPILAVVALISFIVIQNDFVLASVTLRQPKDWTLAVGLFRFVSQRYGARWGPFAAGALLAAIPIVTLWFALQRYIVSGLTAGAEKG